MAAKKSSKGKTSRSKKSNTARSAPARKAKPGKKSATSKATTRKRAGSSTSAARGSRRPTSASRTTRQPTTARAKKSGTKAGGGLTQPMLADETLAAVIGNKPMPRTEVTKKVWEYIRKNDLQDKNNRRQINADEKLRAVFGGKKSVSMFELTKHVANHLEPA